MRNSNHSFYKYHDIEKFDNLSFKSKYSFSAEFYDLEKYDELDPKKEHTKTRKMVVYDTASE